MYLVSMCHVKNPRFFCKKQKQTFIGISLWPSGPWKWVNEFECFQTLSFDIGGAVWPTYFHHTLEQIRSIFYENVTCIVLSFLHNSFEFGKDLSLIGNRLSEKISCLNMCIQSICVLTSLLWKKLLIMSLELMFNWILLDHTVNVFWDWLCSWELKKNSVSQRCLISISFFKVMITLKWHPPLPQHSLKFQNRKSETIVLFTVWFYSRFSGWVFF